MFIIRLLSFGLVLGAVHPMSHAQTYPAKPVRVINAYAAGGTNDIIVRPLLNHLSGVLGQQFLLEAKPGANGNIGAMEVVRAAPDGYTLLFNTMSQVTINHALYKMPFDSLKDLTPITMMSANALTAIVNANVPANNFKELIAYARANPGKLAYSSAGNGSINHLAGELLKMQTKTEMLHVPYGGGGPALTAVVAGDVAFIIQSASGLVFPHLKSGRVKILGVSSPKRLQQIPDVPTFVELGLPDFKVRSGNGFMGPANLPRAIVDKLNAEINKYLNSPEGQKQYASLGVELIPGSPEDMALNIREELSRWSGVVKAAGIKLE